MTFTFQFDAPKAARPRPIPCTPVSTWKPGALVSLAGAKRIAVDVETYDPHLLEHGPGWARGDGEIVGVSIGTDDGFRGYYPIRHRVDGGDNLPVQGVLRWLSDQLGGHTPKVFANALYDVGWLQQEGVAVRGPLFDVQFAEALLSETARTGLDALGLKYCDEGKRTPELYRWCARAYGGKETDDQRKNIYRAPPSLVGPYAEGDVDLPLRVLERQIPALQAASLLDLFAMECGLIPLLVAMRFRGVRVDVPVAERLSESLLVRRAELQAQLEWIAKGACDVNAGASLQAAFDRCGYAYPETDKGNPSFTKTFLDGEKHDLAKAILAVRRVEKLRTTFIQGYILDAHVKGRVHGQFHPLRASHGDDDDGTRSGRFACVAAWTPIETPAGPREMQALEVGDRVWTHAGRWRKVLAKYVKPPEDMWTVTFCSGQVLTCTSGHRLLDSSGTWRTLKELQNEHFSHVDEQPAESSGGACCLSIDRTSFTRADRRKVTDNGAQCFACSEDVHAASRKEGTFADPLLAIEGRGEEPDARQNGGCTSQLDRGVRRWPRVSNVHPQWQAGVCSPCCHDASNRGGGVAGSTRGAPHRRQPEEQCFGQPCACHTHRAQRNPLLASEGCAYACLEKIDYAGRFAVHDLTVEEDASYYACGVFSHNSSSPNLQNLPSRDKELAPLIRGLFLPDEGAAGWWKADYSQIEYRAFAHFAIGRGAERARAMYLQDPRTDFHEWTLDLVAPITKWDISTPALRSFWRKPIKSINFGLLYGMGKTKLTESLHLSPEEGDALFAAYHAGVPFAKATMEHYSSHAQKFGQIRTIMGRISRFEAWEPDWRAMTHEEATRAGGGLALPYEEALRAYGPRIRRAKTHKALNRVLQGSAADLMKMAMLQCWEAGVFDVTGVPALTVHDELDFSDPGTCPEAFAEVVRVMESAIAFRVPIVAEVETGPDWGHTKKAA